MKAGEDETKEPPAILQHQGNIETMLEEVGDVVIGQLFAYALQYSTASEYGIPHQEVRPRSEITPLVLRL